jgi:hypothetical protein
MALSEEVMALSEEVVVITVVDDVIGDSVMNSVKPELSQLRPPGELNIVSYISKEESSI